MFTLCLLVKQSVAERASDSASGNVTLGTIFALEQDYIAPFVKDVIPETQGSTCSCSHYTGFCNALFHYPVQCEPSLRGYRIRVGHTYSYSRTRDIMNLCYIERFLISL